MVGLHVAGHLARRGYEAVTNAQNNDEFKIQQLKKAAQLYEDSPDAQISPVELLPMLVTFVVFAVLFVSVRYTLGEVVSTLAMIEQPQTVVVERTTRVVDGDEFDADAPLDKKEEQEHLIAEEVILVKQDPITASLRKTMQHLHNVGGFTSRWRGIGAATCYHLAHTLTVKFISSIFWTIPMFEVVAYVVASVLLSRIHMTWTHVMISKPSPKPWFKRNTGDKTVWKALVLPSAVYALAQIFTMALPLAAFIIFSSGVTTPERQVLAAVVSAVLFLALSVLILLPASVTLTRIEASFLADDEDTIVPFDRTLNGAKTAAISLGETQSCASRKSLFIEAWRSFDMSSRVRLIKFFVKMIAVQSMIVLVGLHVIMAEFWMLGLERLSIVAQAGSAQLRLAAMGIEQD